MTEFWTAVIGATYIFIMVIIIMGIIIRFTEENWKGFWKMSPLIFIGLMIGSGIIYLIIFLPLEWIGDNL